MVSESESVGPVQLALLERSGETLMIEAVSESTILLLNGEPIDEPVAGYGPFVMNTKQEIDQAFEDLRNGRLVS